MSETQLTKADDALPEKPTDTEPKRFVEKGPQVILDTETNIFWLKKDSWQDKGKFFNWHESKDYADTKNLRSIGGFDDWRLPLAEEAETLFDETKENPGKGGINLRLDTAFPEGAFKSMWLMGDTSTRRPRLDLTEGNVIMVEEYSFGSARLCRKGTVKKNPGNPKKKRL